MLPTKGSLPTTIHEEQWKRLMNRDMEETDKIVAKVGFDKFEPPPRYHIGCYGKVVLSY